MKDKQLHHPPQDEVQQAASRGHAAGSTQKALTQAQLVLVVLPRSAVSFRASI